MSPIIGVCGFIGSGKGTVADMLIEEHGYMKLSFADKLKDTVSELFEWDRNLLEGDTPESRNWREQSNDFWTKEIGKDITPRHILQVIGNDMRKMFYDDIWISFVKQKMQNNPDQKWVIPDVRYPNEINLIKEYKGQVWHIIRGNKPEWWNVAVEVNKKYHKEYNEMNRLYPNIHESEWRWVSKDKTFDKIITNDSTLEDLKKTVLEILTK